MGGRREGGGGTAETASRWEGLMGAAATPEKEYGSCTMARAMGRGSGVDGGSRRRDAALAGVRRRGALERRPSWFISERNIWSKAPRRCVSFVSRPDLA